MDVCVRKYESIWIQLKDKSHCAITAHHRLHPRIIKAVVKEKYEDREFKFVCDERCKSVRISSEITGNRIRFFLTYYDSFDIGDI